MKNLFKLLFMAIGSLISFLFPNVAYSAFITMKSYIYTGYRRKEFGRFGKKSLMASTVKLVNPQYIYVGSGCEFFRDVKLTATRCEKDQEFLPEIRIGNRCQFGECTHITAINSIIIGDNLLTGSNVLITDNAHGDSVSDMLCLNPQDRPLYSKGKVIIGNNVWLCNNVCILSGVTVGSGVIVAANSVVTHDIPDNCVVAGMPAKIIKVIK